MPITENRTEMHSGEVQDIIGKAPARIVRSGTVVVGILVLLLFAGAWAVHYPDVVSARVILSSFNPPVKLVAQVSGRITAVRVNDGDWVEQGQVIAAIDNPGNLKDMLTLSAIVDSLDTALDFKKLVFNLALPRDIQVGTLQAEYAELFQAISNYRFVFKNSYYADKKAFLQNQREYNRKINDYIHQKSKMLDDQLTLEAWKDSVNKILVREKVIAPAEYNAIKKNYLTQDIASSDNSTTLLQNESQLNEYQKALSDLLQQHKTDEKDVLLSIRDASQKIRGQLASWEQQYLFRSPVAGKVVFFRVWKANQYVNTAEPVFMVVPALKEYEVRAELPIYKAGKIKVGQRVLIKLQEYPFEEFGMLRGKVEGVTNVALDSAYTVHLSLVNGLLTTRKRLIDNRPTIVGTADIITDDKSILQRLFEGAYGKLHQ